ncbi:hypothetical protein B0J11DRAFT_534074 [Dendryphion nanum]|uniref:Uncharacterized protein n=1 Tax=Dendryphion nanum TaxID=256645 RepID=A0A9P9DJ42_9PLEO|nr:hypothetical protein B0J11DRAFT_534074 [Dendryphion nanum]
MCAGATVFAALKDSSGFPEHRVGVIGMGGLGHLAVQFAARQGRDVAVFSRDGTKKQEALALGARGTAASRCSHLQTEIKSDLWCRDFL